MKRLTSESRVNRFCSGLATSFWLLLISCIGLHAVAQTNILGSTNLSALIMRPLSMADALDTALQQNGTILQAKSDLEASYGIVVQTRAIAVPKIEVGANVRRNDPNFTDSFAGFTTLRDVWNADVRIVQSIYEGGRIVSSIRTARLTKEQALLNYQTTVADTLLALQIAYYDVLVAEQQITVNEASVALLSKELEDQQSRFQAGTVPRFNVLRAEVAVANARPALIRARNAYRIAKNNLSNLLGYNLPREVWEDIPLQLTDKLEARPYHVELPGAIAQALEHRTELGALRKAEQLQRETVVDARAGYKPSIQGFAGYGAHSSQIASVSGDNEIHGWFFGGQLSWNIFDGMLTRGRVMEANARYQKSRTELSDTGRRIELEVRTAYSTFIEAREVLESQQKVQEEAEEALRLARARAEAGTGTQLDVLDAETSLTQARTTQLQALHDYSVARARLERAIGQDVVQNSPK
jgi:outer membrane protein